MPSGRKDIYGAPSRRLADPKVIKAEMGAQRNAAAAARLAGRKLDADKLLAREGTTNPSGGRTQAVLRTAPPKPVKPQLKTIPAKQQAIIRTTTNMKPTPARERNSIRETRKK